MKRTIYALAALGAAVSLAACQQQQEDTPDAATGTAADVNVTTPPDVNVTTPPDVNVTTPPDVTPDVNINPPDVNVPSPPSTTTESTTVTVPGVGSTTTTTEKR